jgi:hypothetical protein
MIKIFDQKTGFVFLRNFDEGIFATLGASPDTSNLLDPCYAVSITFPDGVKKVPVYFSQPEPIFKKMVFPFITINRDDVALAMHRWMGVGQLEYRAGVSGTQTVINGVSGFASYESKPQAFPHDITYTISMWDRYEAPVQVILQNVLKALYPVGRLLVYDSLKLQRSYEYYWEGSIANLQEIIDPVTRARGYALTIRVEGELDLAQTYSTDAVTGVDLYLHRF